MSRLLDLLGEEALLALSREFSGCDVYVPRFEMVLRAIHRRHVESDL